MVTVASGSSTTEYTSTSSLDSDKESAKLTIVPKTGHIVSQISFDNTNWVDVAYYEYAFYDTDFALKVTYYASTKTNVFAVDFDRILPNYFDSKNLTVYVRFASGSYSGLKKPSGGVEGVAVTSTYGGVAMIVGADLDSLGDDDTVVCSTMAADGYEFMYWMDEAGNKLSFNDSERFKKKVIINSVLTAVFAPIGTDPNTYFVVDNSE